MSLAEIKKGPVERRPAVKELTDKERLDFLDEYCLEISVKPKGLFPRLVTVRCDDVAVRGFTWRQAVDAAKAAFDEANS